ncbi:MAG: ATP-binding cassette domain-containing protein [Flavobacteriales bacterium]|nr:ATP-binding cassette domain-containing protein [Flavobacteriales bacterium]
MRKTPVILESEKGESGAICLAMILGYYDSFPKLNVVKEACNVSNDEILPENLITTALRFCFNVKHDTNALEEISVVSPIIIKTNSGKYALITKENKNGYIIHDTEKGTRKITKKNLKNIYAGWYLKLTPGNDFEAIKKQGSYYKELSKRIMPNVKGFLFVFIAGIIMIIPGIILPSFKKLFFDDIISLSQIQWFDPMISILAVFIVLGCLLVYLQQSILLRIELKSMIIESSKFISHVLRVPYNYFFTHDSGKTVKRLILNDEISTILTKDFSTALIQCLTIVFYGVIMLKYNWILSLVGVSLMLGNILALRYFSEKRTALNQSLLKNSQAVFSTATSGIEQIETIKASGAENDFFSLWSSRLINSINDQQKLGITSRILVAMPPFIDQLNTVLVLVLGGLLIMKGEISIGVFLALQSFLSSLSRPVQGLVEFTADLQSNKANITNIIDTLQEPIDAFCDEDTRESINTITASNSKLTGKLEVKNISFGYSKFSEPLIQNFSLTAYPGKRIAIIGGSGSGKSTLLKVISGLYQPLSGEINYDDKPINTINKDVFKNSLSIVDQDTFFFSGTVSDNITMWNNAIDNSKIIQSAKDSRIHEEIVKREEGYNSKVKPGGKNFSGGQKQRLEIARALVTNPSILFLDEATSALDTETESLVMNNILKRNCTTITIAHRLSTIKNFDEIIVLEKGKVIQQGNHFDLIKDTKGLYFNLIKKS